MGVAVSLRRAVGLGFAYFDFEPRCVGLCRLPGDANLPLHAFGRRAAQSAAASRPELPLTS